MSGSKKKRQKRPYKDGSFGTPKPDVRKKRPPWLTRRRLLWFAVPLAVAVPPALIGLAILATNPDYGPLGIILAVLILIVALGGLMLVRTSGWMLWPGVALGIVLIALPGEVFKFEVMKHRGVSTEVAITSKRSYKKKGGGLSWTCHIRRTDGQPLPHAKFSGDGCDAFSDIGSTRTVVVDPAGWVPPISDDFDYSDLAVGVYGVGGVWLLWALLVADGTRRRLRQGIG
ncbi:hypothetical protein AB0M29_36965 [Streptomyces sp. NPDC051976]|uniref:hypothetical protein n=1 Tax=Streptomyces sp. NPDC051976 TaxID=3154947 RepID=UPI00344719B3